MTSLAPANLNGSASTGVRPLHYDLLIVGAGISGIDAAYRFAQRNKRSTYAILEGRQTLGGTWDLFRYPGIRSDSDMATLGFPFNPWREERSIADGGAIRDYVVATAKKYGIDRHVRFGHRVVSAAWSSATSRWTVVSETADGPVTITCGFLFAASGYYDYERGHAPEWPNMKAFEGTLVYPQFWPAELDYTGKSVVVIGSGATAVTLVPAMAERAAHVTMLQRSPSYIASLPAKDTLAIAIRKRLPRRIADSLVRYKNIAYSSVMYTLARKRPATMKKLLRAGVLAALGAGYDPAKHDVDVHFTPSYEPWDQRLCLVPDSDLFVALAAGKASIETGHIAEFTPRGLRLQSGKELPADVVVSATGLSMRLFGGVDLTLDGERVTPAKRLVYKGSMLEGIPNFAFSFGYTNASWTLKVDLNARFVGKLIRHMRTKRLAAVIPKPRRDDYLRTPLLGLNSGYVQRAADQLPQQGPVPWRVVQNYFFDRFTHLIGRMNDKSLVYRKASRAA